MPTLAPNSPAAQRWYVYMLLCRGNAIYTGIALDVAARYAQHVAGNGARYTRANPPTRILAEFACPNRSVAGRLEAAIKRLPAADKRKLIGKTGAAARALVLEALAAIPAASTNVLKREAHDMPRKEPTFAERLGTAVKAKRTQLEKIRAATLSNDTQAAERQSARVETAEARSIRAAETKASKRAAADQRNAQRAAEKLERDRVAAEEKQRKDAERVAQGKAAAALKLEQKAARDSRYAARKARQK